MNDLQLKQWFVDRKLAVWTNEEDQEIELHLLEILKALIEGEKL